jgi:hypothetical protein
MKINVGDVFFEDGELWGIVLKKDNDMVLVRTFHYGIFERWFKRKYLLTGLKKSTEIKFKKVVDKYNAIC